MNPEPTASNSTVPESSIALVPYRDDPLAALADRLITDFRGALPVLDKALVLLPGLEAAPRLRKLLLERVKADGHSALLGPRIMSLREWVGVQALDGPAVIGEHTRELVLVEALREHGQLFGKGNVWALADSLLCLFDELTLNKIGLPENLDAFIEKLAQGYGFDAGRFSALDAEARLVHTLWHAWHQQLDAMGFVDRNAAYMLRLSARLTQNGDGAIYVAGFHRFDRGETTWLRSMLERGRAKLFLHGQAPGSMDEEYHPDAPLRRLLSALGADALAADRSGDDYSGFLEAVFAPEGEPLADRAHAFAQACPRSLAAGRVHLVPAAGAEEEARVVDLQVRRWLLEGHRNIAVVTEDRRLARRVRALLERAGVILQDSGGWALSTTSAAAALERWLECVEENFPHLAMLDLLKSPFLGTGHSREEHLETVYRLEQDIILHENVGRSLQRYKAHIGYRKRRLPDDMAKSFDDMAILLDRLHDAAAPLGLYVEGTGSHRPDRILDALSESMGRLGMDRAMAKDAAGARLMEEIGQMRRAVLADAQPMSWLEFRAWLGRTLERYNFRPAISGQPVQLMGLSETSLGNFDALIIAGAEQEYLPGGGKSSPFFNDSVRHELGLPALAEQLAERLYHFRRLMESAPQVLITLRGEQDGEDIMPSPWVEALDAFHKLAYGSGLGDDGLLELVRRPGTIVVDAGSPLPGAMARPRPALVPGLVPESISASTYQQLMDCPYQFFAARGLGLAPPDAIREALQKSDFGERVHRCLEAFHSDIQGLPGPFRAKITAASKSAAIDLLRDIAHAVFADDLDDNFLHRGWLQRWLEMIEPYVTWEMERAELWTVHSAEIRAQRKAEGFEMKGRLDRIDASADGFGVVDYKTGFTPREAEVLAGESVQLPFYAVLAESVCGSLPERVEFLALDRDRLGSRTVLEGDALHKLTRNVNERLGMLMKSLQSGTELPAWGDEEVCSRCAMESVCRRQSWENQ